MTIWDSLWNTIWWFLIFFFFISYLMALFAIFGDLFRDRELSGWGKAGWVIFLVFVPFLAALVYLIARGKGMGERSVEQARQQQAATDQYVRNVAGSNPASEIAKAKELLDAGAITQEEFDQLKAKALA